MSFSGLDRIAPPGYVWDKVKITQIITDAANCYPWTRFYAWIPVRTVSGKYVWRQSLYRRKVWIVWGSGLHSEPVVQYATDFDIIAGHDNLVGRDGLS